MDRLLWIIARLLVIIIKCNPVPKESLKSELHEMEEELKFWEYNNI